MLDGLPITLHDGTISGVKARIPWPNPLTSTLGFSLESLHLVFHLLPVSNHTPHNINSNINLAESVASVADSFIHNELTPREEATLRESFHPDLASSIYSDGREQNVPGGLDPFLSAPEDEEFHPHSDDPAGISIFATLIERLLARFEFDAVDTKITIVHPGHTSFTLSVSEIRYGTESRGADDAGRDNADTGGETELEGATRTISISGVEVTARNLHPPIQILRSTSVLTPSTLSPTFRRSPSPFHHDTDSSSHRQGSASPASSSSSLDEDTQFNMSQSLAFLPPRPSSPTSSLASSMYQSAISNAPAFQDSSEQNRSRTPSPGQREQGTHTPLSESHLKTETPQLSAEDKDETILSFGTVPIVLRLTTPPPVRPSSSSNRPNESTVPRSTFDAPLRATSGATRSPEKIQLSLVTGILACSFRAWQIRGLLDLVDSWTSHHVPETAQSNIEPSVQSSTPAPSSFLGSGLDVYVSVKGVVLLLLLSSNNLYLDSEEDTTRANFFLRPLVPPRLHCAYLRLHLEGLTATASLSSDMHSQSGPNEASSVKFSVSLSELSIFYFRPDLLALEDNTDLELRACPILITDHHLPEQYPSAHEHPDEPSPSPFQSDQYPYPQLPIFDVVDWTDGRYKQNGTKVALWRSKQKRKGKAARDPSTPSSPPEQVADILDEQVQPAIIVSAKMVLPTSSSQRRRRNGDSTKQSLQVDVNVAPLHMFVDLEQVLNADGLLGFLDEMGKSDSSSDSPEGESGTGVGDESDSDEGNHRQVDDDTPPATPRVSGPRERERERERERRRLEKLVMDDLDLDIDYRVTKPTPPSGTKRGLHSSRKVWDPSTSFRDTY